MDGYFDPLKDCVFQRKYPGELFERVFLGVLVIRC